MKTAKSNIQECLLKTVMVLIALTTTFTLSHAQASLAAENIIDDIKVTTSYGKEKIYT